MKTIEERISFLESFSKEAWNAQEGHLTDKWMMDAKFMALHSIVSELAIKEGLTPEQFDNHFSLRSLWWHDHLLKELEDTAPELAARLDLRRAVHPSIHDPLPPLFPEPN